MPPPLSTPQSVSWRHLPHYSYAEYWALFSRVVEAHTTTGPEQNEALADYTRLNHTRSKRLNGRVAVPEPLKELLTTLQPHQTWLVLTEAWCGDAAQNLPYLNAMAEASGGRVELRLLLRDENPELMDRFLTGGARAIPKLIALNPNDDVRFTWGARPSAAQAIVARWKENPSESKEEMYLRLHAWYAENKGAALFTEFAALLAHPA